jgi:hypothetical protein
MLTVPRHHQAQGGMADPDLPSAVRLLCAFAWEGQPVGSPLLGASAYERQVYRRLP